jgi:hypothetical protein
VVVDAEDQRILTRPLARVNGEVCTKERKRDLTRAGIVRDGMRRPVSSRMRYAPNDRRALKHKIKETGDEED